MKTKLSTLIITALTLIILSTATAMAATMDVSIKGAGDTYYNMTLEAVDVYINGKKLVTEQPAVIYEGRTLIPLRAICEALNCEVKWDNATQTAMISNPAFKISMAIGSMYYSKKQIDQQVNGETPIQTLTLDVAAQLINGNTMVPARAISESLNAYVAWDAVQRRVDITMEYDFIGDFVEDMASVEKNGKYGFINKKRQLVIPLIYNDVWTFSEGLARVKKDGKWGYVDKSGKIVISLIYDRAISFFEGLAAVEKDGKWGYIDKTGKVVIPIIYDDAWSFFEGLAAVEKDGKWGYIDKTGKVVIPIIYDVAWSFFEGLAEVKKDGEWFRVDKNGNRVD